MKPLVADQPENLEYLRLLGTSYDMYGIREFQRGQYPASKKSLKKAIAILEGSTTPHPRTSKPCTGWPWPTPTSASSFNRPAIIPNAFECLRNALAILEALEERSPKSRRHQIDRARCLVSLGVAQIDMGRCHEAETSLRQADQRLGRLSGEDTEAVDVWYWLAVAKQGQGRVALARGRIDDAGRLLREAIATHKHAPARKLATRTCSRWRGPTYGSVRRNSSRVAAKRSQPFTIESSTPSRHSTGYC